MLHAAGAPDTYGDAAIPLGCTAGYVRAAMLFPVALIGTSVGQITCHLEHIHYPSLWNTTALRVCEGPARPERVCIVGGGPAGVHLGWLLKRRRFTNVTIFERNSRLGGDVWTRERPPTAADGDNVTRELGAAFLSPDYDEVRALLTRFGQHELPLSTRTQLEFHVPHGSGGAGEDVLNATTWAAERLARVTNSTNATQNAEAVAEALSRYEALHRHIFGAYEGRFPPEPETADRLALLNATGLEFLQRHELTALEPLMYQFFVLQGMGLLKTMPAYYVLKWASPASLSAGGFGDHSDEPLAMLPAGYGAIVDALAAEADLEVRLGWRVSRIERHRGLRGGLHGVGGSATLFFDDGEAEGGGGEGGGGAHPPEQCDVLALTGPIPEFVGGSLDGSRKPILAPPTAAEVRQFGSMRPMQFLISLLELTSTPRYETLEYWPDAFEEASEVIVRRDVGFGESGGARQSHPIGGLQSYSYWPVPTANFSTHWAAQQRWAASRGLAVKRVLAQNYIDTYLFHHNVGEVARERRPWTLRRLQLADGLCNCTLFVGGAASFEAVEDVLHHNLRLVSELFDADTPLPPPPPPSPPPSSPPSAYEAHEPHQRHHQLHAAVSRDPPRANVLEQLVTEVRCDQLGRYLRADASTWTAFLRSTPGYVRKAVGVVRHNSSGTGDRGGGDRGGDSGGGDSSGGGDNAGASSATCEVWTDVGWMSRELWKSIPAAELAATQQAFVTAFGADPPAPKPLPAGGNGLLALLRVPRLEPFAAAQVEERLAFSGTGCGAGAAAFVAADNATYTAFLQAQPGFVAREILVDDSAATAAVAAVVESSSDDGDSADAQVQVQAPAPQPNCTIYTRTRWADDAAYEAVCAPGAGAAACASVHERFVRLLGGHDPPMRRLPLTTAVRDDEAPHGPRMAVLGGIDVVAYHALASGEHDVRGSPAHRRWLNASSVLPPTLLPFHPRPYELWFASEANAVAFEASPLRFLPAFGGHCTHGISSRNDLNATLLADGRVAFTCVNGSRWSVLNGTLYMNSCGMWPDFEKDPEADIAASRKAWRGWFGTYYGPLNDACVQDEAVWGGNPIGGLIPRNCVLN